MAIIVLYIYIYIYIYIFYRQKVKVNCVTNETDDTVYRKHGERTVHM